MARLSTNQTARALGVDQNNIKHWSDNRAFPAPVLIFNHTLNFYDSDQVAQWLNSTHGKRALGDKIESSRANFEARVQKIVSEISVCADDARRVA
jgi:hypothetical protein